MAVIRRFSLWLIRPNKSKSTVKTRRRSASWNIRFLPETLQMKWSLTWMPCAIRFPDCGLRGLFADLSAASRGSPRRIDGGNPRRQTLRRHNPQYEPVLRLVDERLREEAARSHPRHAGQAHGRDRLPDRRQAAIAARRLHRADDVLSRPRRARRHVGRRRGASSSTTTGSPITRSRACFTLCATPII